MLLKWAIMMLVTFSFASCSGDDDDDTKDAASKAILGTWTYDYEESGNTLGFEDDDIENYAYDFKEVTFNEDGTYEGTTFYNTSYKGTYTFSGSSFTMSGKGFGNELMFEKNAVLFDGVYNGFNVVTTITKFTIDINGDKMTKTLSLKNTSMGLSGREDVISFYNRKK
jgi:hypothetical protein